MLGTIHIPNDVDYYKITLTSNSSLTVTLNNTDCQANNNMRLYNSDGILIGVSEEGETGSIYENDTLSMNALPAGTYYVEVYPNTLTDISSDFYEIQYQATALSSGKYIWTFVVRDSTTNNVITNNLTTVNIRGNYDNFDVSSSFGVVYVEVTSGRTIAYNVRISGYNTSVASVKETASNNRVIPIGMECINTLYGNLGFSAPFDSYTLSSPFGWRSWDSNTSTNPTYYNRFDLHLGIDIKKGAGVEIKSICDITFASSNEDEFYRSVTEDPSMGFYARVTDAESGMEITYMHMQEPAVDVNALGGLVKGATIGKVGTTGDPSGNHLHIQAKTTAGKYIDLSEIF